MIDRDPLHLVMRTGAINFEKIEGNLIEEHNKISSANGHVYIGKAGRRISLTRLQSIQRSIEKEAASKLIVVYKGKDKYIGYSAPLYAIFAQEEFSPSSTAFPEYYHDLKSQIGFWMKIGTFVPMETKSLERFSLVLNDKPLLKTLRECRTSLLLVHEG